MSEVKIIECPRDAIQGIKNFIPTELKIEYLNQLLKCNFDTLDFGSFVSAKAIPQMADTAEVLNGLDLSQTETKLLAIIANEKGALEACKCEQINYLGFPFSISETFQQRNTNSSISESIHRISAIQESCIKNNKTLVVYISMAFGNPYGEEWNSDIVVKWSNELYKKIDVKIIALSDTIGISNAKNIKYLFEALIPALPKVEFGAHLHTTPNTYLEKIEAAYLAGCKRFDGAIKGFGGCPMATDKLTGNMPTEKIIAYFDKLKLSTGINQLEFEKALAVSSKVFV